MAGNAGLVLAGHRQARQVRRVREWFGRSWAAGKACWGRRGGLGELWFGVAGEVRFGEEGVFRQGR
jgi:hypothetical protein